MSRRYRFSVEMELADDDQTDPEEVGKLVEDVLNGKYMTAYRNAIAETLPEYRPKWTVARGDNGLTTMWRIDWTLGDNSGQVFVPCTYQSSGEVLDAAARHKGVPAGAKMVSMVAVTIARHHGEG